jgi:hypothetical protein
MKRLLTKLALWILDGRYVPVDYTENVQTVSPAYFNIDIRVPKKVRK